MQANLIFISGWFIDIEASNKWLLIWLINHLKSIKSTMLFCESSYPFPLKPGLSSW